MITKEELEEARLIKNDVCRYLDVTDEDIKAERRNPYYKYAKLVLLYLVKKPTDRFFDVVLKTGINKSFMLRKEYNMDIEYPFIRFLNGKIYNCYFREQKMLFVTKETFVRIVKKFKK